MTKTYAAESEQYGVYLLFFYQNPFINKLKTESKTGGIWKNIWISFSLYIQIVTTKGEFLLKSWRKIN